MRTLLRRAALAVAAMGLGVTVAAVNGVALAATGPSFTGSVVVGRDADGRLEIFAQATDTQLYHKWQLSVGGAWSGWEAFGPASWPTVAANADGRLELVAIRGTKLVHRWQLAPNGTWSDWYTQPDGSVQSPPALIQDGTGRLRVFAVSTAGTLMMKSESAPSAGPWSSWVALSTGGFQGYPALGRDKDGRLEMVIRTSQRTVAHTAEASSGSGLAGPDGWTGWDNWGGDFDVATPVLAANADGHLDLFAIGTNSHVYGRWQTSPNGGWSNWFDHGGSFFGTVSPVMAADANSRLAVFAMDTGFNVGSKVETTANSGPWIGWTNLGGGFGQLNTGDWSGPSVVRNSDGTLQLFMIGHAQVYTNKQQLPSLSWTGWTLV
jgi:hypothetical protein